MTTRAKLSYKSNGAIAEIIIDNFKPVTLMKGLQQTNTLDTDLFLEIGRTLKELNQDNKVKTIVFTGINPAGSYPVFCDGIDLTFLANLKFMDFGNDMRTEVVNHQAGITVLNYMAQMNKYLVARLNGHCIGGGLEFALGCDYLISLPKILIGFPEAKYGILPGWNGLQSMAFKIGRQKTLDLYFEGFFEPSGKHSFRNGIVLAEEAAALGIVDEIVSTTTELDLRVGEITKEFAEKRRIRRPKPTLQPYKTVP